ncbi:MAG TPA: linear amide C-N hydrolase [Candidatus Acidoferrales bacterium]|nr:linear amide C-N hydrolase [Candidatus Acidoferrales bacterium]
MKQKFIRVTSIFAVAFISVISASSFRGNNGSMDPDSLTLNSLRKLDRSPFYTMTFYGDYYFKDYLDGRIEFPRLDSVDAKIKCTCFAAMGNSDSMLFGRNFDYPNSIPLLLFTHPRDGYASMSMTDLDYFGYSYKNLPDSCSNRKQLLKTPWLPIDGVNEKGVAIGIMTVEKTEPPNDSSKRTINEAAMIRLVLDYAGNVEEAIELIRHYNVNTTLIDPEPEHYLIADPSGQSVIVEFLENDTKIIRNQTPWQVATNFNVYGKNVSEINDERYLLASAELKAKLGNVSTIEAMAILKDASEINTRWLAVYNMTTKKVVISIGRNFDKVYRFNLTNSENDGSN